MPLALPSAPAVNWRPTPLTVPPSAPSADPFALPVSDALQDRVLSLPISPVHTPGEIDAVIAALAEIAGPRRGRPA